MGYVQSQIRRVCEAVLSPDWMMFHGSRQSRAVALTFDDGPHPEHTPRLLDELARLQIRATFFVIGECAQQRPDLIRRIAAEGHAIGHHTWTHSNPEITSARTFAEEVGRTQAFLEQTIGQPCRLFRPPRGQLTVLKTLGLWLQRQNIVLWNVDSDDCRVGSSQLAPEWIRSWRPQSGDVVLLHDDSPLAAKLVDPMSERVQAARLRFATVPEMLGQRPPVPFRALAAAIRDPSSFDGMP